MTLFNSQVPFSFFFSFHAGQQAAAGKQELSLSLVGKVINAVESHRNRNRQANGAMGGRPRSEGRGEKDRETRETRETRDKKRGGGGRRAGWLAAGHTRLTRPNGQPARQTTHPRQDCLSYCCNEGTWFNREGPWQLKTGTPYYIHPSFLRITILYCDDDDDDGTGRIFHLPSFFFVSSSSSSSPPMSPHANDCNPRHWARSPTLGVL